MDADVDQLQRVVNTMERRISILLDLKAEMTQRLDVVMEEVNDLIHARQVMLGGIDAVKSARDEPAEVRH
jgi:hypothetical protein